MKMRRRAALALALAPQCTGGARSPPTIRPSPSRSSCPMRRAAAPIRGAHRRQEGEREHRPVDRDREQGRRRRDPRHRPGRQGRARRLHAAARPVGPDLDQSRRLQEPALRSGEGFRADHHDDGLSLHPGRQFRAAGQDAAGVRGAGQEQARRDELRLDRRRRRQSSGRRAVQQQGRAQDDPRALSRHGAGGRRSGGRPAHHGVRRSDQRPAAHQVGQAARARRDQPGALAGRARGADRGRERLSRLRGAGLARHPGAGQDAAGDRSRSSTRRS